jgi:hypothetical protein
MSQNVSGADHRASSALASGSIPAASVYSFGGLVKGSRSQRNIRLCAPTRIIGSELIDCDEAIRVPELRAATIF